MRCRELESRLEALLDGELDEPQRQRCERHLEVCAACRELVAPFWAPAPPAEDLVGPVLARTSGASCRRAGELLPEWVADELEPTDRDLVAAHLDRCGGCRELAAVIARLGAELPALAELRPGPGFVAAVLGATLPASVRLRRWWASTWPRWLRRPRFASEAAFVATLVLVLVFATPGSPLEALPTRALELARTDHAARLDRPITRLERGFAHRVREPIGALRERGEAELAAWTAAAAARGRALGDRVAGWLGTSRELLASLWGSADEPASDDPQKETNPSEETP